MKKHYYIILLMLLVSVSLSHAAALDYTSITITSDITAFAGYPLSNINNGVYSADTSGAFFSTSATNGKSIRYFLGDNYNITFLNFTGIGDWSSNTNTFVLEFQCNNNHSQVFATKYINDVGAPLNRINFTLAITNNSYLCSEITMFIVNKSGTDTTFGAVETEFYGNTPEIVGIQPSLTLSTSIINNSQNGFLKWSDGIYRFGVNGTSVNNSNIYSGTLYISGTPEQTFTNLDLSTNTIINYSFSGYEKPINLTINFYNENASNNKSYNLYFDGIDPEMNTTFINNSVYARVNDSIGRLIITDFADNNLYAVNTTIKNSTNGDYVNRYKPSPAFEPSTTYHQENITMYIDALPIGQYTYIIEAWDSHTATYLKPYDARASLIDKSLTFDEIKISTPELINDLSFNKLTDRYNFNFDFREIKPSYILIVESQNKLDYLPNSQYKAHFVDIAANKWVDFEGDQNVKVVKISDYKYSVEVTPILAKETELKFNSIGDLNHVQEIYYFNVTSPSYFYANDNNTGAKLNDFGIKIYNSTFSQEFNTTSGLIVTNITKGNYNLTYFSDGYLNRTYANITLSNSTNITGSLNASGAFTVYIKNQLTSALISQLVTLEFIPVTANTSKNYTTSIGAKYINDLDAGEWIIRYSSANYSDAFYYFTLVNGTSEQFTIYMLPTSDTTNVTAYVYDEVANVVKDAIIHVQRYDLNTNSYLTVEIVKTNFEGRSLIHVTKNTEFYKFLIYYNGDLKLSTESSYIYDDTITFQIQLGDEFAENFYKARGVDYSLYYNPSTYNVGFTFANAENTITNGTLRLYNVTGGTRSLYNLSSVASTSGTILLYARNISGTTYIGEAWVTINGVEQYLNSISVVYITESDQNLQEDGSALFYLLLMCVVFAFVGFFDLTVAVILTPLPIVIGSILGFISIAPFIAVPIEILAIIVAIMININK